MAKKISRVIFNNPELFSEDAEQYVISLYDGIVANVEEQESHRQHIEYCTSEINRLESLRLTSYQEFENIQKFCTIEYEDENPV